MVRRIICLLLAACMLAAFFPAAVNATGEGPNETTVIPLHNMKGWSYNEQGHWQECSCGEIHNKEEHKSVYAICGEEAVCDTCGATFLYEQEHDTYWDYTAGGHWRSCFWCAWQEKPEEHADKDGDGVCEVCGYAIEDMICGIFGSGTWELDGSTLYVYSFGDMPDCAGSEEYPWYAYRNRITEVYVLGSNVGSHTFQGYPYLRMAIIESMVSGNGTPVIGSKAFADNEELSGIAFYGDAPQIAGDAFANVTAQAICYGDWDTQLYQDYGGDLNWSVESEEGDQEHEHSYDTDWEYNDYRHWHECLLCDAYTDSEGHADGNNDRVCDVCGYNMEDSYEGIYGDCAWSLQGGSLYILGTGAMEDQNSAEGYPWYAYKDQIREITVMGVDIGDHAFEGFPELKWVYICADSSTGENVSVIGTKAFGDCGKLGIIEFWDEAPNIVKDAFAGVSAHVICYKTWEEELVQNYGGALTWDVDKVQGAHTHSYESTLVPLPAPRRAIASIPVSAAAATRTGT